MAWQPIERIAYAVAIFPFKAEQPADLPLQVGDELYIIEQNGDWYRGYLQAAPSLLTGLTSSKGQVLEARIFTGIFPRVCVEVRELLGEDDSESLREKLGEDGLSTSGTNGSNDAVQDENLDPNDLSVKPPHGKRKKQSSNNQSEKRSSRAKKRTSLAVIPQGPRDPSAPKPQAPVPMLKIGDETPTSASEPLVDEIASCLREWHDKNFHELLLSREYPVLDQLAGLTQLLDKSRRQILHKVLTKHELGRLREQIVWDLVRGNRVLNGEVIVRDPALSGRLLTGEDSAVEITRLQSMMSLLDERPLLPGAERLTLHHLLLDVRSFVGTSTEPTTLVFFLASKTPSEPVAILSESYVVEVPASGTLNDLAKQSNMRTLFADLVSANFGDDLWPENDLYLVVRVLSVQQIVGKRPESRAGRDSISSFQPSVMGTTGGSVGRATGRRSLMWGKGSQRNPYGRNANNLDSLNESSEHVPPSRDGASKTADGARSVAASEQKSSTNSWNVQRTVGIGALKVSSIMKQDEDVEQMITIWSTNPGHSSHDHRDPGAGWEDVIGELLGYRPGQKAFEKSRRAERLQVHLKSFAALNADDLIKETPTLLSGVLPTNKMGFAGAPTKPRSDIYFTLDEAFLPRQGLIARSNGGATVLPNNLSYENLQITLEVRKANGDRLENVIYHTSQAKIGQTTWQSAVANRGDSWRQTLKLVIPTVDVPGCHIVLTVTDVPCNHPFGITYVPLWDRQAFIRDGYHSLQLYRWDDSTRNPVGKGGSPSGYLNLAWNARGRDDVSRDVEVTGPLSTIRVQTYLCSTRLTQDKDLLGLLKWKDQEPAAVQDLLKRLVFVPEIEIVKLLPDVFDAIFGILTEQSGNDDFEDLIFTSLVTVLGIVHDRRFNLQPLVDQYAETQFVYPFACPCLVQAFTRLLSNPSDPDTSRKLRATFKVVRHILKFISHARGQQVEKEAGIGITSGSPGFTRQLSGIFKSLESLMRSNAPILVGSQTLAVQYFHTWVPELAGLLSTEEIVHIAVDFMDSCASVKGKLILYKLVLIINYSKLELFSQPEQRQALCMNTVRWIAPHWGKTDEFNDQWRDQIRLCCTILSTQVQNLANEIPDHIPKIINSYLGLQRMPQTDKSRLSLLFPTAYPFPSKPIVIEDAKFDEALIELSAILSAISNLPAGMQLELAEDDLANLIEDILLVHLSILQCDAFPANWLSVHIYHHKSTMRTLEYIASILLESFIPDPEMAEDYNTELWKMFFTVLLKLVGSDSLALETFTEQKRRAVWKIAGDIREEGAALLDRTWRAIGWDTGPEDFERYQLTRVGGYQVQYIPGLVGPVVELCLSVHVGLRAVAVQVLQSMIISEYTLTDNIAAIQTEIIDCLAHLFKTKPLTESVLEKLFIGELLELFEPLSAMADDPLYVAIQQVFSTVNDYLDLLVAVYNSDTPGEASRLHDRLRLMAFFRDYHKDALYISYVHDLANQHLAQRQSTEAGLALRLHADLYKWDNQAQLPALTSLDFPPQSQYERKERLYFDMIKHFEEGQAWGSALAAYEELAVLYSNKSADYLKLARTERSMATIHEKIPKLNKVIAHYFRVIFRGLGFSHLQRDKEYIYEATITEKLPGFMDRLLKEFPHAEFITSGDVSDLDAEGQFLIVSEVAPHRDHDHFVYQQARVPQSTRDFLLATNPSMFAVTSKRNTNGPVEEHFYERTVYKTQKSFPALTRRSEIVSVEVVRFGAVETALHRITRRTAEMNAVEKRILNGEHDSSIVRPLVDSIAIAVEGTFENSFSRYRVLLPVNNDPEDPEAQPKLTKLEEALKVALVDYAVLIKRCLTMFGKPENAELLSQAERENLLNQFEGTFAIELAIPWAFPNQARTPSVHTPTATEQRRWSNISARYPGEHNASRRNSLMAMLAKRDGHADPPATPSGLGASTNSVMHNSPATVNTAIMDSGSRTRNRLSGYFSRGTAGTSGHERQQSEKEAILAPVVNLQSRQSNGNAISNGNHSSIINGNGLPPRSTSINLSKSPSVSSTVRNLNPIAQEAGLRGRQTSDAGQSVHSTATTSDTRSNAENSGGLLNGSNVKKRTSSFFNNSLGRSGGRNRSASEKGADTTITEGEDSGWVTDMAGSERDRRSMSSNREQQQHDNHSDNTKQSGGGSSGVGGVRKRLSLLKLGKKSSKGNIASAGAISEED